MLYYLIIFSKKKKIRETVKNFSEAKSLLMERGRLATKMNTTVFMGNKVLNLLISIFLKKATFSEKMAKKTFWGHDHFCYASIRSFSLGAPFWYIFSISVALSLSMKHAKHYRWRKWREGDRKGHKAEMNCVRVREGLDMLTRDWMTRVGVVKYTLKCYQKYLH